MQAYFNQIWHKTPMQCRALFISVPRFLLAIKENITNKSEYLEKVIQSVRVADLVIWDDIAAKTGTEYEINNLLSLIDSRLSLGKSNIFTSNILIFFSIIFLKKSYILRFYVIVWKIKLPNKIIIHYYIYRINLKKNKT